MAIPPWAIKSATFIICVLLTVNGFFVNRLVTYIDDIGKQVGQLSSQVAVLQFEIKSQRYNINKEGN